VPAWVEDMIGLWEACRPVWEAGYPGRLPDKGGAVDQSTLVMHAFAVLDKADAAWREERKRD